MALSPRAFRMPQCTSCIRRLLASSLHDNGPVTIQTRGKKTMPKSDTITVRLLEDTPTFGRAGAVVPVPRGQMRNRWFPQKIASYVLAPELKKLKQNNTPIERDFAFEAELIGRGAKEKKKSRAQKVLEEPEEEEEEEEKSYEVKRISVRAVTSWTSSPARYDTDGA